MNAERCLLTNTAIHLRDHANVRAAIAEMSENPGLIETRVNEFDSCLSTMKSYLDGQPDWKSKRKYLSPDMFRNLFEFRTNYQDLELGSIRLASHMCQKGGRIKEISDTTFKTIASYAESGEWNFVTETADSGKLASGLIIEGYGKFLEEVYEKPGLARDFVLTFEEVLACDFPNSTMFNDIKPWMQAEADCFTVNVKEIIAI